MDPNSDDDMESRSVAIQMSSLSLVVKAKSLTEMFYDSICDRNASNVTSLVENHDVDVNMVFEDSFVSPEYKSWTPLHVVCKKGHAGLVGDLLRLGADQSIEDKKGEIPLHIVCKHGHIKCIELLLKHDLTGNLKNKQNKQGLTPLCKAAYRLQTAFKEKSYYKTVDLLIKAGCDVNLSPVTNMSPLHIIAQKWSSNETIEKLVKAGADVNAVTKDNSPLMSALCRPRIHKPTVSCLIDAGADVNYINPNGKSVLHVAVSKSEDICVEHLLQAGADPNVEDSDGNSPLWIAVSENNITITPLLLKYGGDVNFTNRDYNMSLLCKAVFNRNMKMISLLLDHRADVDRRTVLGASPLHYAVASDNLNAAKLLLQRNCLISNYSTFCDEYMPQNALEIALCRGDSEMVKLLLRMGFPVDELSERDIQMASRDDADLMQWVLNFKHTPRSLLHLCRVNLRARLGTSIGTVLDCWVKESYIPRRLRGVLMMDDVLSDENEEEDSLWH